MADLIGKGASSCPHDRISCLGGHADMEVGRSGPMRNRFADKITGFEDIGLRGRAGPRMALSFLNCDMERLVMQFFEPGNAGKNPNFSLGRRP